MFKFIGRHWRGEANFWLSVVFSIVLPISIIAVGAQWVGIDALQDTPQSRLFQAAALFSLLVGVGIWQLVGTWRASSKKRRRRGGC